MNERNPRRNSGQSRYLVAFTLFGTAIFVTFSSLQSTAGRMLLVPVDCFAMRTLYRFSLPLSDDVHEEVGDFSRSSTFSVGMSFPKIIVMIDFFRFSSVKVDGSKSESAKKQKQKTKPLKCQNTRTYNDALNPIPRESQKVNFLRDTKY